MRELSPPGPRSSPVSSFFVFSDVRNLSVICEVYYVAAKLTVVLVADSARFFKQFGWIARYQFVRLGQRSGQASGPKRTVILGPEVRRKGCPKRTHFGATLGTTLGTSISLLFQYLRNPKPDATLGTTLGTGVSFALRSGRGWA